MKIIDLLNKIANGEIESGTKFKYNGDYFKYWKASNTFDRYEDSTYTSVEYYNDNLYGLRDLNNEVEIIEEEKKIPEKLEGIDSLFKIEQDLDLKGFLAWQKSNNKIIENKINEIIDYLNNKGE